MREQRPSPLAAPKSRFHTTETVMVRTIEAGLPRSRYSIGWRTFKRVVEPCACDIDYTDVEIARITVNKRGITVYRHTHVGSHWTSDYESVTRYGTLRTKP